MTNKLTKADNFNTKNINISENIRVNKYGGKSVYVNYLNGPLRLQFPQMKLPFGISKFTNPDKPDEVRYSMELAFKNNEDKILKQFVDLEEKIIDYVEKNSKEIFKKQKSREVLKDAYKSHLRFYHDDEGNLSDKYAPRLKVKIYTSNGNFQVDAYEAEKVDGKYPKIQISEENFEEIIGKGSQIESILQCTGIWVVGQAFGVSWVLNQAKVYKNDNKLSGFAFEEDDEETVATQEESQPEEPLEEKEPVVTPDPLRASRKKKIPV